MSRRAISAVLVSLAVAIVVLAAASTDPAPTAGRSERASTPVVRLPTTSRPSPPPTTLPPTTTIPPPTVSSDPASVAVLVNLDHGLPPGWVPPDLVAVQVPFDGGGPSDPKHQMRREAADALAALFAAARLDGIDLVAVSGYRSEARQRALFSGRRGSGEATRAPPGHSEHQSGLAVDVSDAGGACTLRRCFADRPAGRWLAFHSVDHGFVLRYPAGKEDVTGYAYEPWHLRYVGVDLARRLAATGLALDEARLDG